LRAPKRITSKQESQGAKHKKSEQSKETKRITSKQESQGAKHKKNNKQARITRSKENKKFPKQE
jgi:hypothetical protein